MLFNIIILFCIGFTYLDIKCNYALRNKKKRKCIIKIEPWERNPIHIISIFIKIYVKLTPLDINISNFGYTKNHFFMLKKC